MPTPARFVTTEAQVRAHFGFTQHELARYLGVSAALVAHYETGRRVAPPAALLRLTRLALLLPPPAGFGPPEAPAPAATPANPAALPDGPATPLAPGPLHARQRDCRLLALTLGRQLARLQGRAAAQARARRGLAQLQAALAPTAAVPPGAGPALAALGPLAPPEAARLAAWLAEVAQNQAGLNRDPAAAATAQVLLAVRIAALTAEADALGRLLAGPDAV